MNILVTGLFFVLYACFAFVECLSEIQQTVQNKNICKNKSSEIVHQVAALNITLVGILSALNTL